MRISDWSSDVCSSDLKTALGIGHRLSPSGGGGSRIWRDVRCPSPGKGGYVRRRGSARIRIDHTLDVKGLVVRVILHPLVGHDLFPAGGPSRLARPFDPTKQGGFAGFGKNRAVIEIGQAWWRERG